MIELAASVAILLIGLAMALAFWRLLKGPDVVDRVIAIDTLYVRLGDGLAAVTVLVGVHLFAMSTQSFFIFNVSLVIAWLAFTVMLVREHHKAAQACTGGYANRR